MPFLSPSFDLRTTLVSVSVSVSVRTISRALGRPSGNQSSELGEGLLGFVALIVLPDEFAVVHAPLVRVAHVVVGAGVLTVQTLTEEVIFYFYGAG